MPHPAGHDRLTRQFAFLEEAGQLKSIVRANCLIDLSRAENSAEHSWHLALYAMVFAPEAPVGADIDAAIRMLLLHDIVEVDAGDHPIHEDHDPAEVARSEAAAAARLFGLLPADIGRAFSATWRAFEARETETARFAAMLDNIQPVIQTVSPTEPIAWHLEVATNTLHQGRAFWLRKAWPALWSLAAAETGTIAPQALLASETAQRLVFLKEADRLKSVLRATPVPDGCQAGGWRHENSGEHSWHIALYALTLADQAGPGVDTARVIRMLLIHDIVEIDAGDAPIHGDHDPLEQEAKERAAADRLFGLLPGPQAVEFRALWDEFEAAQTADAIFAKSIDRVQPLLLNLASGGGSWTEYNVTLDQLDSRIGVKVAKGAPEIWRFIRARVAQWFAA